MKIAVIGCGYWGKNLVRNIFELGFLGGVCDENKQTAEKMSATYSVPILTLDDIKKSEEIHGVVIASPAIQHGPLAKDMLSAGKHVFVEKPLSLTVKEAQEAADLAKASQKILMVGHLLHYHPAYIKVKEMVESNTIGDIHHVFSYRMSFGKVRTEENVLWSFSPHDLSMVLGLIKETPTQVSSQGVCYISKDICDISTISLNFANNKNATICTSWIHPEKIQTLTIIGKKGALVFDDTKSWEEKITLYPQTVTLIDGFPALSKESARFVPVVSSEPLKNECQHFIDCIINKTSPITCSQEGVGVLKILEAAQESMDKNKPVSLNSAPSCFFSHPTAFVDEGTEIGKNTKIWHFSHILKGSVIGQDCTIGQNVMIGPDVSVGKNCKIQNNVSLYNGVTLEDGVFCGPSCVFTNVHNPRAEVERKNEYRKTYVEKGVTIGANATIVCGVRLGAYSFIGAGAVVTKDVKPHALMVGNPARPTGWMSHSGEKLDDSLVCKRTGDKYLVSDGFLTKISGE